MCGQRLANDEYALPKMVSPLRSTDCNDAISSAVAHCHAREERSIKMIRQIYGILRTLLTLDVGHSSESRISRCEAMEEAIDNSLMEVWHDLSWQLTSVSADSSEMDMHIATALIDWLPSDLNQDISQALSHALAQRVLGRATARTSTPVDRLNGCQASNDARQA